MKWSVYHNTSPRGRKELSHYAILDTPNADAVAAGVQWAVDPNQYVLHALACGFEPTFDDLIPAYGEPGCLDFCDARTVNEVLRAASGSLDYSQALELIGSLYDYNSKTLELIAETTDCDPEEAEDILCYSEYADPDSETPAPRISHRARISTATPAKAHEEPTAEDVFIEYGMFHLAESQTRS